jgi:AcrR family transcriptional regulator
MSVVEQIDGRRARADANRRRIAEAMIELVREGDVSPSADQVAERAGVGRRTVFRLFDDMEGVYREIHTLMAVQLAPMFLEPFASTTWREKLDEIVERRAKMFEIMLPVKSVADMRRPASPFLQKEHEKLTQMQRKTLRAVLPERVATQKLDALDLALSFESWRRLRREQKLSPKQAAAVVRQLAAALVD